MDDWSDDSERSGRRGWSQRHRNQSPPRRSTGQARDRTHSPPRPQSPRRGNREGSPRSQSPRSNRRVRAQSPRRQSPERHSPRRQSPRPQNKRHTSPQDNRHTIRDHSPRRKDNSHASHDQSPDQKGNIHAKQEQALVWTLPTEPSRQVRASQQRSPLKAQSGQNPKRGNYTRGHQHKQGEYRYPNVVSLEGETTTARLEVFSIVLHILVVGSALMVIVPMAIVTTRWETERKRCPLFVDKPPGLDYRWGWGNPDMTPCNVAAYLPIIVLVLSVTLLLFHSGLLHIWRIKEEPPAFAFTRIYTLVVLAIVALETLLTLCVALILTEGFRHTCISFDLNLSWNEHVSSCQKNFADRDEAYVLDQLHTFAKIVMALASAWFCAITTILLTIVYITRSKICSCELVCI